MIVKFSMHFFHCYRTVILEWANSSSNCVFISFVVFQPFLIDGFLSSWRLTCTILTVFTIFCGEVRTVTEVLSSNSGWFINDFSSFSNFSYSSWILALHSFSVSYSRSISYRTNQAGIYVLKVNIINTRTRYEICSKLTLKTPERPQWHPSGVSNVNFEYISHLVLVFLLLTLNS